MNDFNLVDFLDTSIKEGKNFLGVPAFLVDNLAEFDFDEVFDSYEDASISEMINYLIEGKYLFVTFSDCGVNNPDVACIDGGEYQMIEKDEEEEYFDEEGAPEDFVFTDNLFLGETSSIGYLLTYSNGEISIESAQFYVDATNGLGPCDMAHLIRYSSIEPREDVEVFEKPMEMYLKQFIK